MAKSKSVSKTSMDGLANQTPAEMIAEANRLLGSQKMQPTGSVVDDLNKRVKSYCGMFPDSLESLARQAASDLRLKEVSMSILGKLFKSDKGYIEELEKENERLQFIVDSLCSCIENPQDEQYLLTDKNCPIHGKEIDETD